MPIKAMAKFDNPLQRVYSQPCILTLPVILLTSPSYVSLRPLTLVPLTLVFLTLVFLTHVSLTPEAGQTLGWAGQQGQSAHQRPQAPCS